MIRMSDLVPSRYYGGPFGHSHFLNRLPHLDPIAASRASWPVRRRCAPVCWPFLPLLLACSDCFCKALSWANTSTRSS